MDLLKARTHLLTSFAYVSPHDHACSISAFASLNHVAQSAHFDTLRLEFFASFLLLLDVTGSRATGIDTLVGFVPLRGRPRFTGIVWVENGDGDDFQ